MNKKFILLITLLFITNAFCAGSLFDRLTRSSQTKDQNTELKQAQEIIKKYEKETRALIEKFEAEKSKTQKLTAQVTTLEKENEKLKKGVVEKVTVTPVEEKKTDEKAEIAPVPPIAPPLDEAVPAAPDAPPFDAPDLTEAVDKSIAEKKDVKKDDQLSELEKRAKVLEEKAKAKKEQGNKEKAEEGAKIIAKIGVNQLILTVADNIINTDDADKNLTAQKFENIDDELLSKISNKIASAINASSSPSTTRSSFFNALEEIYKIGSEKSKNKIRTILSPIYLEVDPVFKKATAAKFGIEESKIKKESTEKIEDFSLSKVNKKGQLTITVGNISINSNNTTDDILAQQLANLIDTDVSKFVSKISTKLSTWLDFENFADVLLRAYKAGNTEQKNKIRELLNKILKEAILKKKFHTRVGDLITGLPLLLNKLTAQFELKLDPEIISTIEIASTSAADQKIVDELVAKKSNREAIKELNKKIYAVIYAPKSIPMGSAEVLDKNLQDRLNQIGKEADENKLKELSDKISLQISEPMHLIILADALDAGFRGDQSLRQITSKLLNNIIENLIASNKIKLADLAPVARYIINKRKLPADLLAKLK